LIRRPLRKVTTLETERGYRAIVEAMPIAVWIVDRGETLFVNSAFERLVGYSYEELLASGMDADLIHADDRDAVAARAAVRSEGDIGPTSFEVKLVNRGNDTVSLQCDATAIQFEGRNCVLVAARDVTAQRAAEAREREVDLQLQRSARLESVGLLAGGVAHEFNNLLTVIIGYGELAAASLDGDNEARLEIAESVNAARKAAAITRQLLTFASRQSIEPCDVDLNGVVTDAESLLQPLIGEHIVLSHRTSATSLPVHIDPGQFEQVIVNLVVNARDAMPEGGQLTLETSRILRAPNADQSDVAADGFALLTVTDTGTGIRPELMEHIFEPFFTTKEQGKGTGLGLATCYGIVKQAGGSIAVDSKTGLGTSFKVYLPLRSDPITA
jgi:two-component system cell cycle sensor histidine kinase/response regulator CckA